MTVATKRFEAHQHSDIVEYVNSEILHLTKLQCVPLGPDYSTMEYEEVQNNLALYRLSKNFERPSTEGETERKNRTILSALKYDADGISSFNPAKMALPPHVRKVLYEVRNQINTLVDSYRFSVGSAQITTGESFISSNGDTSILAKLRDQSQWCVTPECFDLFAGIAYRTLALKRQVKYFYWQNLRKFGPVRQDYHKWVLSRGLYEKYKDSKNVGFECFKWMLRKVVTFVGGTRFTTVPKSNEVDRLIECEAMCNMIVQRVIAKGIIRILEKEYGIFLPMSQDLHKGIIRSSNTIATIDLKNASNSVWMSVVEWLFKGTRLLNHVKNSRCSHVIVNDEWYYLNMVAPMGNGFTFELMTLMLTIFIKHYDPSGRVFGDDIIINQNKAVELIELLQHIGFQTNVQKTFITGHFRESCGGFVSHGRRCHSFEFQWAEDMFDSIVLINKLRLLSQHCYGMTKKILTTTYHRIRTRMPLLCFCGSGDTDTRLEHVIYESRRYVETRHRNDVPMRKLFKLKCLEQRNALKNYQASPTQVCMFVYKKSISYRRTPLHVYEPHWVSYYLYSGRVIAPTRRRQEVTSQMVLMYDNNSYYMNVKYDKK